MQSDVGIGVAFMAGIISFISPCVLPLVPAYIGYMGGRMTQQVTRTGSSTAQFRQRFGTFIHGLFFVFGFTLFFVLFGLLTTAAVSSLTSLGASESDVKNGLARVGGVVVILFGLHIMGILNRVLTWLQKQVIKLDQNPYGSLISALVGIAWIGVIYWLFVESWFLTLVMVLLLSQVFHDALKADTPGQFWTRIILRVQTVLYVDTRHQTRPSNRYGYLGSMFMGVVFSAGWTPCIGPIYGSILTLASNEGSLSRAGILLFAYSLGLGIPFLLTALALDEAQSVFRRLQRNMRLIETVSGLFLILIGVLVFSGQLQRISQAGSEGGLGGISLNLENCVVGAVRGEVRWGNVPDCLQDGPKKDFYVAAPKPDTVAALSGASDATFNPGPENPTAPESGLDIPSLSESGGELSVPNLAAGPGTTQTDPSVQIDNSSIPVGLEVGQRAPNFTAALLDGQIVSLSNFRGQMVLINFWATWCDPCRAEMPDFQTIYDLHRQDGFVVLAVNDRESAKDVQKFVEELGLDFPVVLDQSGAIRDDLYGSAIPGYPTSFLIDRNGVIVKYFPRVMTGTELLDALDPFLDS